MLMLGGFVAIAAILDMIAVVLCTISGIDSKDNSCVVCITRSREPVDKSAFLMIAML